MLSAPTTSTGASLPAAGSSIESNGLNVITESERRGTPRVLFWPWFASNISVLAIPYGAYVLGFGLSFWQAVAASVVGIVLSFLLCGFVSLAGKRGSAPTMVVSRASFGINGNRLPSLVSWLLTVGSSDSCNSGPAERTSSSLAAVTRPIPPPSSPAVSAAHTSRSRMSPSFW